MAAVCRCATACNFGRDLKYALYYYRMPHFGTVTHAWGTTRGHYHGLLVVGHRVSPASITTVHHHLVYLRIADTWILHDISTWPV